MDENNGITTEELNPNVDLDDIMVVAEKAFSVTSDSSLEEWFSFSEMKKSIQDERGVGVKAITKDHQIVGVTYAQQENPINSKEGTEKWVIVIAAVDPEFSGQGVGKKLLAEIEKQAAKRGAQKMFVYTNKGDEKVVGFYKKNGYLNAGWVKDYQYGKNNSAVFLIKHLS